MYQTLQTPERIGLTPEEATSRLTEKYAGLIGLTPFEMFSDSGLEVQREIDELWRGVNKSTF